MNSIPECAIKPETHLKSSRSWVFGNAVDSSLGFLRWDDIWKEYYIYIEYLLLYEMYRYQLK